MSKPSQSEKIGLIVLASLCLGPGMGLTAYQAIEWLKTGTWEAVTLGESLAKATRDFPRFEWRGVQSIFDAIGAWPLWVVLLIIGAVLAYPVLAEFERQ